MEKLKDILKNLWESKNLIIGILIVIILFQGCRNCSRKTSNDFQNAEYITKISDLEQNIIEKSTYINELRDSLNVLSVKYEGTIKLLDECQNQAKSLQDDKRMMRDFIKKQQQ